MIKSLSFQPWRLRNTQSLNVNKPTGRGLYLLLTTNIITPVCNRSPESVPGNLFPLFYERMFEEIDQSRTISLCSTRETNNLMSPKGALSPLLVPRISLNPSSYDWNTRYFKWRHSTLQMTFTLILPNIVEWDMMCLVISHIPLLDLIPKFRVR